MEVIQNMPNDDYRKAPGWSQTQLKDLLDNVELFHGRHILGKWPRPESPSMALGSMVHALLLGGQAIVRIPAAALTSNGQRRGKAWDAFKEEHAGDVLVLPDEYELARYVADSVLCNTAAARLLAAPGLCEESLFWTDEETGIPLKARLDKQTQFATDWVIADLKVMRDPTADKFQWSIADFGYHIQAAFYWDAMQICKGISPEAFVFICVRNEPPYECRVWELAESAIEKGRELYRRALCDLAARLRSGDWLSPNANEPETIDLPEREYRK